MKFSRKTWFLAIHDYPGTGKKIRFLSKISRKIEKNRKCVFAKSFHIRFKNFWQKQIFDILNTGKDFFEKPPFFMIFGHQTLGWAIVDNRDFDIFSVELWAAIAPGILDPWKRAIPQKIGNFWFSDFKEKISILHVFPDKNTKKTMPSYFSDLGASTHTLATKSTTHKRW